MPAAIPAIAGFAASTFFTGTALAALEIGATVVTSTLMGAAIGAVTGAVVGGLQAAITGGDIGDGILYGAVGGAVGGALGGAIDAGAFSSLGGSGTTEVASADSIAFPKYGTEEVFGLDSTTGTLGKTALTKTTEGGFLSGISDTSKLMLTQGGIGLATEALKGEAEQSYASTEAGLDKTLAQRQRESELQYKANQDTLANQLKINDINAQIQRDSLAQRKYEADLPYAEQAAARDRMRETATGLTLFRKQEEAANQSTPLTDVEKEYQVVV